jgi:hypothetical protein
VREVNGQEEIELLEDGSRWMLRAKEAVYGYSVSLGAADEAWKVRAASIEEGLTPTMAEREQPQLLLVSTAHRLATSLMLEYRKLGLDELETGVSDVLLVEWSAAHGAELADLKAWQQASPHWTPRRQRLIEKRLAAALENQDPEDLDPVASFRTQWLNQWPRQGAAPDGREELLPAGVWGDRVEAGVQSSGPVWVALEDDYGRGAAVAACGRLPDGRLEVDGWTRPDWDSAIEDVEVLRGLRRIRQLTVGASLLSRVPPSMAPRPEPASFPQTRSGLALLRDLASAGQLVHDETTSELDDAVAVARVRETPAGLALIPHGSTHLVKAAVWAVQSAHRPTKSPAIR